MRKLPPRTSAGMLDSPLLGFTLDEGPAAFGLQPKKRRPAVPGQPVLVEDDQHIITFGPTGRGKTSGIVIPNAGTYAGTQVILDLRGEVTDATYRYRRFRRNEKAYVLAPWPMSPNVPTARLEPLDGITRVPGVEVESAAEGVVSTILAAVKSERDPFWHNAAHNLLTGCVLQEIHTNGRNASINNVVDLLFNTEDLSYHLAKMLDDKTIPIGTYQRGAICSYLQLPDGSNGGSTRSCVYGTATAALNVFRSKAVRESMGNSTIDLQEFCSDRSPSTLYLCLPIEKLCSHAAIITLWLDCLMGAMLQRKHQTKLPIYMVIDEAGQLGSCPMLKTISTFLRASGVRLHTFFQDPSQLVSQYPKDWKTILNNAGTWTILPGTRMYAREMAEMVGLPASTIVDLEIGTQLVIDASGRSRVVRLPKYWTNKDPLMCGRFDAVERYKEMGM